MRSSLAGVVGATVTGVMLFVWFQIEYRLVWRTAYTDLPGQNTLHLVNSVQPFVVGVILLVGGRVSGLLGPARRWVAALLSASPVVALVAISAAGFSYWYVVAPVIALLGAYAAVLAPWANKRREPARA